MNVGHFKGILVVLPVGHQTCHQDAAGLTTGGGHFISGWVSLQLFNHCIMHSSSGQTV